MSAITRKWLAERETRNANTFELAKHKAALGKKLTGKCCVTLKRAADIDDELLSKILKGSLAAKALCEE